MVTDSPAEACRHIVERTKEFMPGLDLTHAPHRAGANRAR